MLPLLTVIQNNGRDLSIFFVQAEDGIRAAQESRGLGDVYKRQDFQGILRGLWSSWEFF